MGLEDREYLVSAIVSVYEAEEFLAGCLDDLLAQTIADRIEIIVIDSASPQKEGEIVRRYQADHPNIRYLRTPRRETIYAAWNRGIGMATAPYLTNANADDRHRKDSLEILVRALEAHPEAVLAYAAYDETSVKNDTWESGSSRKAVLPPEFRRDLLLLSCFVGPQPVWRRSLHDEIGFFDDRLTIAGDIEFWLRAAERHRFLRIPERIGLYYAAPTRTNLASRDWARNREETAAVQDRYLRRYLSRLDMPVSLIYTGEGLAGEWRKIFSALRVRSFFPYEVLAVTGSPEEAAAGWEESGGAPGGLRACRRAEEACRASRGEYAVIVPVGGNWTTEALEGAVAEVDEKGYRAGVFTKAQEGRNLHCFVLNRALFVVPGLAAALDEAFGRGTMEGILPPEVEVVAIDGIGWHPWRSAFSRNVRLAEIEAIEYAFRKGRKHKWVTASLVRGELGFWKALVLKGGWREGPEGWIRSALRGWADFLKCIYMSDKAGK